MYNAAEGESFELATYYRDLIRTVERVQAEQQVASASDDEDMDVWGLYEEGETSRCSSSSSATGTSSIAASCSGRRSRDYQPTTFLGEVPAALLPGQPLHSVRTS
jgi:hypothetical protein